jgi:hypothetical protein
MEIRAAIRSCIALSFLALTPPLIYTPLQSQSPPQIPPNGRAVESGFKLDIGSLGIETTDDFSSITKSEVDVEPDKKTSKLWFQSHAGVLRAYSPDRSAVLWQGKYDTLKLALTLTDSSDGKSHQMTIAPSSLWASSISIQTPPTVLPIMGGTVTLPKLTAKFWNSQSISASYDSQSHVSSQTGSLRFDTQQVVKLPGANFSLPTCEIEKALDLSSSAGNSVGFEYALNEATLTLNNGYFYASEVNATDASELNCGRFHANIDNFSSGQIMVEVKPDSIQVKSSISQANGSFLAATGEKIPIPVIGMGKATVASLSASCERKPDVVTINQMTVAGLNFLSSRKPTALNFRSIANDVADNLALPDFLSPQQQQLKAIRATADQLKQLTRPDVLAHVPATEIKMLVNEKLKEIGISKLISFDFGKQEVLAFVPSAQANSSISLALHLAISIEDTYASVRPSVSFAPVSAFSSRQLSGARHTPDEFLAFLDAQLAPIVGPLRKFDTEIKVPIPTVPAVPLNFGGPITDDKTGATIKVTTARKDLVVSVPYKAFLIDSDGLHLMAQVDIQ